MIDVVNITRFPETPEEMHRLLEIEAKAKADHGLTAGGMSGYIVKMWREQRLAYQEGGDNGTVERGILQPDRDAAGDRSPDNTGIPVR